MPLAQQRQAGAPSAQVFEDFVHRSRAPVRLQFQTLPDKAGELFVDRRIELVAGHERLAFDRLAVLT